MEAKSQRENIIALLDKNLIGPVDAIMKLYPDITTEEEAVEKYYPGYRVWFNQIGKERGWPPVTMERFEQQIGDSGAYVIGGPEEVADKLVRHSKALGGISRFTFQIDNAGLSHDDLLQTFTLIGQKVKPLVLEKS